MKSNIDILICGDLCPTKDSRDIFSNGQPDRLFTNILPVMSNANFVMANLEFVLTDNPIAAKKTGPILHGPTSYCGIFKSSGINLLSLANNHVKDCGEEGVKSSLETCASYGIDTFGAGKNLKEAKKPYFTEISGKKVAFLVFAEQEFNTASENSYGANFLDPYDDFELIEDVKKQVDFLIVIYHGGIEHYVYPSPLLQKKCRKFVDKGADLVTCQHSHCIGTIEEYANRKIIYGQGNTVFGYQKDNDSWNQGLILKLYFLENGDLDVEYDGVTATPEGGIKLMSKFENKALKEEIKDRSRHLNDPIFIFNKWKEFSKSKESLYLPQYLGLNRYIIHLNRLLKNSIVSLLYGKKYMRSSHNIIRCEAHNEVLQTILENKLKEEV